MKALVLDARRRTGTVRSIAKPTLSAGEVLIKVKAIALNPVDALYTAHPLGTTGRVLGSDFAGTIDAVGPSVSSNIKPGARVAGFVQGASSINDHPGAFAEFVACPWDLVWHIGNLSFEQAAAVSLCALTAAQALFLRLGVPSPFSWSDQPQPKDPAPKSIFIYGASTSVGLYAAQLVKQAGLATRIGAASSKHFDVLRSSPYQYDHLVDYRSSDWPEQVRTFMGSDDVDLAYDCISEGSTVLNTTATLNEQDSNTGGAPRVAVVRSREGGAWSTPVSELRGLEPSYGAVWEGLGADVEYAGMTLPVNPESRAFTVAFYHWLSEGGKLVPNPVRVMPGGLERVVEDGFALLGSGGMGDRKAQTEERMRPVSAEKLVYLLE